MKKLILLSLLSICQSYVSFAQPVTFHNPEIEPKIPRQEIIEREKNHEENRGVIVLDFEGLGNVDAIEGFYSGGSSNQGYSGPDYGVEFSDNALSIITNLATGGTGNFSNNPSGVTVLFFQTGQPFMNVPEGFDTAMSFFYSSFDQPGSIAIFDELNGQGNLLASASFPALGTDPDLPNLFNIWEPVLVPFNGIAKSVVFGGVQDQIGFDDITLGSLTPGDEDPPVSVPTASWALYLTALLIGVFFFFRIRKII